jgi:RNA 3'-terminal phosphate cyclase (ATP)
MLALDGARGGGQLVRTAVSLSALTRRAFRMEGVRGARSNPGLRPQHLAAVRAVADLCDADVDGAELGSEELTFRPDSPAGMDVTVAVGTAGSVPLVFDAALPLAAAIDAPASVGATGGTDVQWSPPFAYLRRVKLPVLARFGLDADAALDRTGFYPAGGGEATLSLGPSALDPLDVDARGDLRGVAVHSKASDDLADSRVAERQADAAAAALADAGLPDPEQDIRYVESASTGSVVVARAEYDRTVLGGSALGEPGKPAEDMGEGAAADLLAAHRSHGAVDRYLADQVVPFLAVAGGRVPIPEVTDHVETVVDLMSAFGREVELLEGDPPELVADPP